MAREVRTRLRQTRSPGSKPTAVHSQPLTGAPFATRTAVVLHLPLATCNRLHSDGRCELAAGAFAVTSGAVEVHDSSISGSTSQGHGGAMWITGGSVTVAQSVVGPSSSGTGGGCFVLDGGALPSVHPNMAACLIWAASLWTGVHCAVSTPI